MMKMRTFSIARQFNPHPGGRLRKTGPGSGEAFREDHLVRLLASPEPIELDLDGTSGFPSSFLDEAFGGLVRIGYSKDQLRQQFRFKAAPENQLYIKMIWDFIDKNRQFA
jgi:hypothetical protein